MKILIALVSAAAAVLMSVAQAAADVALPHIFSDHMVVQQGMPVPVWGTASAGEAVTVTLGGSKATVTAGDDGKWMVKLPALPAGGPFEMTVAGSNTVTIHDVLVGEVWLCSGQSNMDFTVAKTPKYYFAGTANETAEVQAANYPQVRMFSGEWVKSATPQGDIAGQWKVCTPENVREFSAVGYFFARDLWKALNVPVGIITETFGASTAEAWVRREALEANPQLKPLVDKFDADTKGFTDVARQQEQAAQAKWQAEQLAPAEAADVAAWKANPDAVSNVTVAKAPRLRDPAQNQHNPTVMFNGMIAPVIPYAIQGVLWYQGESIVNPYPGVKLYPLVMQTLIEDWRQLWGREDLPFYIVQVAALKNKSNNPDVREAQAAVLKLPHTGMAVTIDIGNAASVHPKDKQDVGDRLTRIALANVYGKKIEYAGPQYAGMKVDGNKVVVSFTHMGQGLVAKGGDLQWFTIAGADGKFVPAKAVIDGQTVVVSSDAVSAPTAVRYAWDEYPLGCNLYNADGLPAAPFRTDGN
jgi:sialate O-acetylesterase